MRFAANANGFIFVLQLTLGLTLTNVLLHARSPTRDTNSTYQTIWRNSGFLVSQSYLVPLTKKKLNKKHKKIDMAFIFYQLMANIVTFRWNSRSDYFTVLLT